MHIVLVNTTIIAYNHNIINKQQWAEGRLERRRGAEQRAEGGPEPYSTMRAKPIYNNLCVYPFARLFTFVYPFRSSVGFLCMAGGRLERRRSRRQAAVNLPRPRARGLRCDPRISRI